MALFPHVDLGSTSSSGSIVTAQGAAPGTRLRTWWPPGILTPQEPGHFPASHRGFWVGGIGYRSVAWRPTFLPGKSEAGAVPARSVVFLSSPLPAALDGAQHIGFARLMGLEWDGSSHGGSLWVRLVEGLWEKWSEAGRGGKWNLTECSAFPVRGQKAGAGWGGQGRRAQQGGGCGKVCAADRQPQEAPGQAPRGQTPPGMGSE